MGQDGYIGEVNIEEMFQLFDTYCLENLYLLAEEKEKE